MAQGVPVCASLGQDRRRGSTPFFLQLAHPISEGDEALIRPDLDGTYQRHEERGWVGEQLDQLSPQHIWGQSVMRWETNADRRRLRRGVLPVDGAAGVRMRMQMIVAATWPVLVGRLFRLSLGGGRRGAAAAAGERCSRQC